MSPHGRFHGWTASRRTPCAAALALAILVCLPFAAHASSLSVQPGLLGQTVAYDAAPGEANQASISRDSSGRYLVEDLGATISADAGCESLDAHHGRCGGADVRAVRVTLGDGNDQLTIADSAYPSLPPLFAGPPLSADGGSGGDTLIGAAGPDDFDGGPDDDSMVAGGGGTDTLAGGDGNDTLDGGDGDDNAMSGGAGDDTVRAGPGHDLRITGGAGTDTVDGGPGDDDVRGNEGTDRVSGGPGDDTLDIGDVSEPDPSSGVDVLDGGPGADVLGEGAMPAAGGGAGSPTGDVLIGGDGTDTADFHLRTAPLTINLDGVADDGEAGEHDNVQPDVEDVISGSNDDVLTGSAAPNMLDGRGGDDTIAGDGGDDTLVGGVNDPGGDNLSGDAGNDTMSGGPGDDELAGGDGDDTESGGGGADTVEGVDGTDSLTGGAGGDTVNGGDGNDTLHGGEVALVGGDAADNLNGGSGADKLYGGRGNDELDGGLGPDYISGDAEKDTVTYEDRTSKVYVTLDGEANDGEAGENDNVLPNVESVVGGRRGDDLSGDRDGNTVDGADGEDLLTGDAGTDRLLGGDAPDVMRARDGIADEVTCGDGGDLAIADAQDKVIDCETTDRPGARRLIVGRYALLRPQGEFGLRLPGGRRFFRLTGNLKIPIGATVDPATSVIRLATARNRSGARQIALVSAGRFTVRQRGDQRPITELRLAGAFPDCPGSSRRGGTAKRRPPRRLDVDVGNNKRQRGRYEVRGRYSVAGATGTSWVTKDRCDGTLTTVKSGTVRVLNLERNRIKIVKAGQSYLARPR